MKMFYDNVKDDLGQFIAVQLVCCIITRNHLLLQARPVKPWNGSYKKVQEAMCLQWQ